VTDDVVIELQKARLMAYLRRFATFSERDLDSVLLVGFAVGLRLAAGYPDVAARMLVELGPPEIDESLAWVVHGRTTIDPDEPVN